MTYIQHCNTKLPIPLMEIETVNQLNKFLNHQRTCPISRVEHNLNLQIINTTKTTWCMVNQVMTYCTVPRPGVH